MFHTEQRPAFPKQTDTTVRNERKSGYKNDETFAANVIRKSAALSIITERRERHCDFHNTYKEGVVRGVELQF